MTHIFTWIASVNALLLLAAAISGTLSWFQDGSRQDKDIYLAHFVLGLIATLTTLFVHCLVLTYFLGTGRWVKEVCHAYGLPDADLPRQTRDIKRRNTPRVILAMLVTIAAAAAGTASQQGVWPGWVHLTLVLATLAINFHVFLLEYGNVRLNAQILDAVVTGAERIRVERGLPSSEDVLGQEGR